MSGPGRRFDPSELRDADGTPLDDIEAAGMLGVARDLETFAASESIIPSSGFEDRVMAAVAAEAPPRPIATGGSLAALIVAVRDAWRITWSGDRPLAIRAQALALVLLVALAFGSAGTLAAVGVSRLLDDQSAPPTGEPTVGPSIVAPTRSPEMPSTKPSAPSATPSTSPEASETSDSSEEPSATPDATDDGSGAGSPDPRRTPRPTSKPTQTPDASETPEPNETPEPSETPESSKTPKPSETPGATDDSSH